MPFANPLVSCHTNECYSEKNSLGWALKAGALTFVGQMPFDDRDKTIYGGILVPLLGVAYCVGIIIRQRGYWVYVHQPVGANAVRWGTGLLGFPLIFHAIYFGPYRRHPLLRCVLIFVGAALLIYGFVG